MRHLIAALLCVGLVVAMAGTGYAQQVPAIMAPVVTVVAVNCQTGKVYIKDASGNIQEASIAPGSQFCAGGAPSITQRVVPLIVAGVIGYVFGRITAPGGYYAPAGYGYPSYGDYQPGGPGWYPPTSYPSQPATWRCTAAGCGWCQIGTWCYGQP